MSTDSVSSNNFNFFVGAFGLLSTVVSAIFCGRFLLPSVALKTLDETYKETNELYLKAVADGLLPDPEFRSRMEEDLVVCNRGRQIFRESVCQAVSIWGEIYSILTGLTLLIWGTTSDLRELRCQIVTTTQETRRRLEIQNRHYGANCPYTMLSAENGTEIILNDQASVSSCGSDDGVLATLSGSLANLIDGAKLSQGDSDTPSTLSTTPINRAYSRSCFLCFFRLHRHKDISILPLSMEAIHSRNCELSREAGPCTCAAGSTPFVPNPGLHMLEASTSDFPPSITLLDPEVIRRQPFGTSPLNQPSIQAPDATLSAATMKIMEYTETPHRHHISISE